MTTLLRRNAARMSQDDQEQNTWQALAARIVSDASAPSASQRATVGVSPLLIAHLRIKLAKAQRQEREAT
jgi:hypothetical protein